MMEAKKRGWWVYVLFFIISQLAGGGLAIVLAAMGLAAGEWTLVLSLLVANLLAIGLFLLWRQREVTWATTMAGVQGRNARRSALAFLMALPIIVLVNLIQEAFFPEIPDLVGEETFRAMMYNPVGLLTVAVLGPLAEELLFRGGVQGGFSKGEPSSAGEGFLKSGGKTALFLSAVIFAVAHLNPAQMPAAFILGLVLGFAYWWTGSLVAPVCIHVFNNSTACVMAFLSPDDDSLIHLIGGTEKAGMLAVVCFFFLLITLHAVRKETIKGTEKG